MAKFEMNIPADFMSDLLDSNFEEIATQSLEASVPILEKYVKDGCRRVIKDGSRTELVNSWKPWKSGVKHTANGDGGYMLGVSSYGKPSKGGKRGHGTGKRQTTNNDIAWWLENGNSHQAAKPFLDAAAKSAEGRVIEKCQEIYNEKTGAT